MSRHALGTWHEYFSGDNSYNKIIYIVSNPILETTMTLRQILIKRVVSWLSSAHDLQSLLTHKTGGGTYRNPIIN